jgi:uncharacterized protein YndB with AHSA1/START domain
MSVTSAGNLDIVVTRIFDAPVEQVWRAWTEPDLVMQWWGPHGFTAPVADMNVREGGTSRVCMRSPDGHDFHNTWTYQRVIPLQRLEFLMGFARESGAAAHPAELGLPADIPSQVRHVVTFEPVDGTSTELTVREFGYSSEQTRDMSKLGLEQCLDKMATSLAGQPSG